MRQLLERGEDPKKIRVLDIRPPRRKDLTTGLARDVDFRQVDISDKNAVDEAFHAPWSSSSFTNTSPSSDEGITVFHTAANIRFYERHPSLLPLSSKVNVDGTQNIVDAARSIGVSIMVYTSSGSISVRRARFWLWPWEKQPDFFVQYITDDDALIPKRHEDMFSNYAASKIQAERIVRQADRTPTGAGVGGADDKVLRTGCIRPGNGIYGPGGDLLCGSYLVRQTNPTWIADILHNFVYVENGSLAHLCYERCLLDIIDSPDSETAGPDIGGQAFAITDAGPPATYGDVYQTLNVLTDGLTVFPNMSATGMLLLAHIFEAIHLSHMFLSRSSSPLLRNISRFVPRLNGDLINLQPSLFALTMVHLIWDDSRARKGAAEGGIGYNPPWTTMQGLCKLVEEHLKGDGKGEAERSANGGVSFGWPSMKAGRGVQRVKEGLGAEPTKLKN